MVDLRFFYTFTLVFYKNYSRYCHKIVLLYNIYMMFGQNLRYTNCSYHYSQIKNIYGLYCILNFRCHAYFTRIYNQLNFLVTIYVPI